MSGCNCEKTRCHTTSWGSDCGCPTKLSSLCVIYQSEKDLDCVSSKRGDRLELILQNIDYTICRTISKFDENIVARRTKVFNTKGVSVVQLPQKVSEVLMVSYCGSVLPSNGYILEGSKVVLRLDMFGITVNDTDSITVIYNPF